MIAIIGIYLLNVLVITQAQNPVQTKCLPGGEKCYILYKANLTWQQAYDSCLSRNQHLATIQDAQTQSIMEEFATDHDYPGWSAHAWVAGRRSDDMTWRDLGGRVFNYTGYIKGEGVNNGLCMLLNGISGLEPNDNLHLAVPCYTSGAYKAVCEYNPPGTGCPDDGVTIHQPSVNKCNTVSTVKYKSWHDVRQYCHTQGWQLAHTGAGSWDFYTRLTLTDKPLIRDELALWIGIQRRAWVWKEDELHLEYMTTNYWGRQEGVNSGENCMHVGLNARGGWADKICAETSTYFICQNHTDHQITKAFTTTVMESTPPDDGDIIYICSTVTCYVIGGVTGSLFAVVYGFYAILYIKRKYKLCENRKFKEQEPTAGPDYVNFGGDGATKCNNNALSASGMNAGHVADYEEPDKLVMDEYITTKDGSTVPGHSQNEAYAH